MPVLVGYVPTPVGYAALEQAIVEAKLRGTAVHVVNVALGENFADVTFADDKDLDAVRERIEEEGLGHRIRRITGASNVAEEIIHAAEEDSCDLIVVGIRRVSQVAKMLLGSSAREIITSAPCPVLTVRPRA